MQIEEIDNRGKTHLKAVENMRAERNQASHSCMLSLLNLLLQLLDQTGWPPFHKELGV